MTYKIIAAALAISFGMGTAAMAQSGNLAGQGEKGSGDAAWDAELNKAFFMDDTRAQLRSQDEIRTNWGNLSAEQQATVRTDCDATTAAVQAKPGEASPQADANASMTELCDMIGDM